MSGTRATLRNTGSPLNAAAPGGTAADWNVYTFEEEGPDAGRPAALDPALQVGGFSSYHPSGGNFLFGDGRVAFLSEVIDSRVYRQLGHRADGVLMENRDY